MDKKEIGKKIRELREAKGWSQDDLAARLGVKQQAVGMYESWERFPRTTIHKFPAVLERPISYFLGETPLADHSITWSSEKPADADDFLRIPVFDPDSVVLVGGAPQISSHAQIKDYAWINRRAVGRKSAAGLFCIFVEKNSMEPILRNGAIVCVNTNIRPEKNPPRESIWAVRAGEGAVVKHIMYIDGELWLLSANPKHPDYPAVKAPEGSQVIGRVIWSWQEM